MEEKQIQFLLNEAQNNPEDFCHELDGKTLEALCLLALKGNK